MKNTKDHYLKEAFNISKGVTQYVEAVSKKIEPRFLELDEKAEYHQYRVIKAMQHARLSDRHFHTATGYGYDDVGREVVETIYADLFGAEDAIVRPHISSGTHAISLCLYGVLRPGDELLSITGSPYDTLRTVIGIEDEDIGCGTLKDFGVEYTQIELTEEGKINEAKVLAQITSKTKMIYMQRSTGYSWRKALKMETMASIISKIKAIKPDVVVFVDNCYGEFLDDKEPTAIGADLMAGSLIKNPGGGLAPTGGYVAGKKKIRLHGGLPLGGAWCCQRNRRNFRH